jgi:hypothetical protein
MSKLADPMPYQGGSKRQKYFEGWYYKQVSEDEKNAISLIPGISLSGEDAHCFVQYIFSHTNAEGKRSMQTGYCRYPAAEFLFRDEPFQLRIGNCLFSETEVHVDLSDAVRAVKGNFRLGSFTPIKKTILMPNIMGIFAYLPKMECRHGVISMMHPIRGSLSIDGTEIDFGNGKGYIEKDWGTSFPERYIWFQCCNFRNESAGIVFSAADIPLYGRTFWGFLCNLTVDQQEYRFATYNGSKLKMEQITGRDAVLTLESREAKLRLEANANDAQELASPQMGKMTGRIKEDPSGILKVRLTDQRDRLLYEDTGRMAGVELSL